VEQPGRDHADAGNQIKQRMSTRGRALIGSGLFLVLAPGTVAGLGPWWQSRWVINPPLLGLPFLRGVGVLLVLGGIVALLDSFARFALQGLGTPAPVSPTRRLVVTGLYRFVRNPMYLAIVAVILGQAFILGDAGLVVYAGLTWLVVSLFVVAYEEPTLRKSFGPEYDAYCSNVPRWFPRLRPWRGHGDLMEGSEEF